ncbi:MAG: CoA-binding protein [Candidatus Thermoplasmatota archaeon]|nr:CoA-binding protein [Candidatus Thermoplasmatota archaeon]
MEDEITEILKKYRNVAVVGLSDKPERDSYRVASYLHTHGYNIIPVNPSFSMWNGIRAYPDLKSIPDNQKVEIVDIFRKSEAVPEIVRESIPLKPEVVWMQEGVVSEEGRRIAEGAGIRVVMDRCIMKEHSKRSGK